MKIYASFLFFLLIQDRWLSVNFSLIDFRLHKTLLTLKASCFLRKCLWAYHRCYMTRYNINKEG